MGHFAHNLIEYPYQIDLSLQSFVQLKQHIENKVILEIFKNENWF